MSKISKKYKKELANIARQLCYDKDIIDNVENSLSIDEAVKWLVTGRQRLSDRDIKEKRNSSN